MNRREFIGTGMALSGAYALRAQGDGLREVLARSTATLRFGCAAITWGGNDRVAIPEIGALGYRGIQLRASALTQWEQRPDELLHLLTQNGLTFVALSSGALSLDPARRAAEIAMHVRNARFLRSTGGLYLQVTDERPKGRAATVDDYRDMGRYLTELGKRIADVGVQLGYHNHMGALGQSPDDVARVLDAADPKLVKLELDIAHWQAAGGDPVAAVKAYADRLLFLHLKDLELLPQATSGNKWRFVELGEGVVDVRGVLAALTKAKFNGWSIVELDGVVVPGRSPREAAMISKRYLESNGYVV